MTITFYYINEVNTINKITEKEMFDYMFCPAKYEIEHIRKIEIEPYRNLSTLIKGVTNFFYMNLLNGEVVTIDRLKKKWDTICEKNQDIIDSKKNLAGIGLIFNLYKYAAATQMTVIDMNTPYKYMIGSTEITGTMSNPILKTKNNGTELFITDFSNKTPEALAVDMNLKYTLESYSFNKMYQKELDGINVYSVSKNMNLNSKRTYIDYKRLETTIENIAKAIELEIFYPRENILCMSCNAKQYCKYWHR